MAFDLHTLEFDKILTHLNDKAETDDGKRMVENIQPFTERTALKSALFEVKEAYAFVHDDLTPSFGGIHPLSDILNRARIGSMLQSGELMDITAHIDAAERMKRHMRRVADDHEKEYTILKYSDELIVLKTLKRSIDAVIDRRGNIKDDASQKLKGIRGSMKATEKRIKETLDATLNKESDRLTEKLVTMRYDRYVIPVKLSEKNNVKGTILDYSSSGETAYIEPTNVRELSAKKLKLETDERQEIEKILYRLSALVADERHFLSTNVRIFTHLDVLFAKAKYGYALEASVPEISDRINLIKARHPLIKQDEVVANTIAFDEGVRMMVITGSNTGGKTVTLKTVGLLSLMAQSGMMIPALPKSEIRMFNHIRADIGDEQSIEQSLSTFSSHMSRIVDIIDHYGDDQLVLLDELGSGTDPKEGSSLAMSILNHLSKNDSIVIATTHYPELKAYAYTNDSIMNASVEFDEKTLRPTYRLLLRTPGESHAFLIGERLGLKKSIIEQAKTHVHIEKDDVNKLVDTLKTESKRLEAELSRYEALNQELLSEKEAVRKEKQALQEKRESLKERMTQEVNTELKQLREEAKQLIEELETMKTKSFKEHELAEKKHRAKQLATPEASKESGTKDHEYAPGDRVYIMKYNRHGELIKKQKGNQWLVQMGSLKSVFDEEDFEYIKDAPKKTVPKSDQPASKTVRKSTAKELDLRGMRVHEAQEELEKYLDDCALSNQPFATIIHGFGTLALRKMVKDVVSSSPIVKSHRDGEGNEGGKGATIVYFE